MAYTTIVTGTGISSSWANEDVRDQVIVPFASTAARSAAITSPVTGQVSTLTTNLATEGMYVYTSAGTWRLPWNMPWGAVADPVTISSDTNAIGGSLTDINLATVTFTAVANRRYRYVLYLPLVKQNTGAGEMTVVLTNSGGTGVGTGNRWYYYAAGANYTATVNMTVLETGLSAGSTVRKFRAATTGNTMDVDGGAQPGWLIVYDDGPNGAPS